MLRKIALALLLGMTALAAPSMAGEYPQRSVRMVVPYPPGGSADLIGRLLADRLSGSLGQPVVVENRGGASGAIGSEAVARAEPDGYSLLVALADTHAINPAVTPHLAYDPQKDFEPVSLLAVQPFLLVVSPSLPVENLEGFMQAAKARPGKLTYGSNGPGGMQHLAMTLMNAQTGISMLHVPYRGAAPALADVVAGRLDSIFISQQGAGSLLEPGKLRPLAVAAAQRLPSLPDVPTFAEAGIPDFQVSQWYGLLAPHGTPPAIISLLNARVKEAMASPEVAEKLTAAGTKPVGSSSEAFRAFLAEEVTRWAGIARKNNIQLE